MTGLQILRAPSWGLSYASASVWRLNRLHIGPLLVVWGQTGKTCCEAHGINCQQGRDCPARKK